LRQKGINQRRIARDTQYPPEGGLIDFGSISQLPEPVLFRHQIMDCIAGNIWDRNASARRREAASRGDRMRRSQKPGGEP